VRPEQGQRTLATVQSARAKVQVRLAAERTDRCRAQFLDPLLVARGGLLRAHAG